MFDEKNYNVKMDKTYEVFTKELNDIYKFKFYI